DPLAETRLLRDRRNGRVRETVIRDATDRGQDQLLATLLRRGRAAPRHDGELPFRVQYDPIKISKLWDMARTSGHHLTGFSGQFNE
ncbi:MAG: hypothetical protein HW392_2230, partial [Steroidobacteraceae bacterium]|nr:hypothetical protein [Steroidobacteraceae bacterium]